MARLCPQRRCVTCKSTTSKLLNQTNGFPRTAAMNEQLTIATSRTRRPLAKVRSTTWKSLSVSGESRSCWRRCSGRIFTDERFENGAARTRNSGAKFRSPRETRRARHPLSACHNEARKTRRPSSAAFTKRKKRASCVTTPPRPNRDEGLVPHATKAPPPPSARHPCPR